MSENSSKNNSLIVLLSVAMVCITAVAIVFLITSSENNKTDLVETTAVETTTTQTTTIETTTIATTENVSPTVVVVVPEGHDIKPQYDYVRIGDYYRITYDTPGGAGLNVRSEPTYYSSKVVTLPEGTRVRLIDDYRNGENGYVHISFDTISGVTDGWILSAYLV